MKMMQTPVLAMVVLAMVMSGTITSKQLDAFGTTNKQDVKYLAGVMTEENGNNSDVCQLLTGSVVLNRMKSDKWNGSTIEEVIMATDGGFLQYARKTRNNFKIVKSTKRTKLLAKYLLIFGPICPENVVYQGMTKAGTGEYWKEKTPDGYEYFCYE